MEEFDVTVVVRVKEADHGEAQHKIRDILESHNLEVFQCSAVRWKEEE